MEIVIQNLGKILIALSIGATLFFILRYWAKIKKFVLEAKGELRKVSWSTRRELVGTTWVVIVITGLLGVFIGAIDFVLSKLLSMVIIR